MSRAVLAAYLACALIWGTTWYAIRVCIGPGGYPTFASLGLRFAIASAVLVPLALRARPWPRGAQWLPLVIAGVLDAGGYLLVYLGEERVSGGIAAVVYGTQPLVLAVLLATTRMERLTGKHVIGACVSLAGVAVLFLDRLDVSARQAVGVALVVGSVVVATIYSMIMKRSGGAVPTLIATTIFLAVTALVLGAVALAAREPVPWPPPVAPTAALAYLAIVGSVVAFLVYFWLLDRTSLQTTSTLVFVYPLVALLCDALFERAISLGVRAYLGAAITLGGLAVSLRRG
ncbi:MAG TPA: EamA family transporter [Kofleriaceae bacterium]|nr:EamA family transporter [Kofleriaceae bacterium]